MVIDKPAEMESEKSELIRLRELGKFYLQRNMIAQALQTYVSLLEKFPEDVSTLVILGDSYLMAGDAQAAKVIYQIASRQQPDRTDLHQRLALSDSSNLKETSIAGGFPPLHPQAISRLTERLTGHSLAINEEQIRKAAELIEKTVHSDSPAATVSEHLDEIDSLLPAILELNIRQARIQGQSDLAANLIEIQRNLISTGVTSASLENKNEGGEIVVQEEKPVRKIILIGEPSNISPVRQQVIQLSLKQAGAQVQSKWEEISIPWDGYDLVVAHNPHANPIMMKSLAGWAGSGKPILVDMDTDFRSVHTGSPEKRINDQEALADRRSFIAAMQLANVLTFPSTGLAMRFANEGYQAYAIPDGWSSKNSLWNKQTAPSSKLNLGLFIEPGGTENAASIRRVVIRILREFPQTRLVVSGDPEAYSLFSTIPDTRRIYLPPTEPDDHPFLLAQADIHLYPYSEQEGMGLFSDRSYMETGVRKAVWVGSPLPAAEEWNSGGLIARSLDDWYTHLKTLIMDVDLRQKLAYEGYTKALTREANNMAPLWEAIIQKTLQSNTPRPFQKEGK